MKRFLFAALAAVMIFTACASSDEKESTSSVSSSELKSAEETTSSQTSEDYGTQNENVLTLSMRTATMLNPLLNMDQSVDSVLRLMFKPLISFDKTNKPQGEIAESWYYTNDGTSLTVKLKSGLKWHDGSNITASDVVYSINTIKNSEDGTVYKKCVEKIRNAVVSDSNTVNINFTDSYSGNIFSLNFPIISEKYYRSGDRDLAPMGCGEYRFKSFIPAKEIELEASENSFGSVPSIKTVIAKITTDEDTDIYSFSQKITDCVVADESSMGKYDLETGTQKISFTDNYYEFIGFNFNNDILKDKNIRKAVASAVPIDNIIDSVYLSNAVKTASPVSPTSFLYDSKVTSLAYDINKAKEYVTLAGYKYDNNTNLFVKTDENGQTHNISLRILVNSESKERRQTALKLSDELKTVGINAYVDAVDFDTYTQKLQSGDFDLFIGGWKMSLSPYFGFMFSSSNATGYNYISYSDEKMDLLLDAAYKAVSEADMIKAYSELEAYTVEELPYVSLLFRKSALFVNKRISGNFDPVPYDYFRGIESWSTENKTDKN